MVGGAATSCDSRGGPIAPLVTTRPIYRTLVTLVTLVTALSRLHSGRSGHQWRSEATSRGQCRVVSNIGAQAVTGDHPPTQSRNVFCHIV